MVALLYRKAALASISHGSCCGHDSDERDHLNYLPLQYFYLSPHKMFSVILLPPSLPLPPPLAFQLYILFCPPS